MAIMETLQCLVHQGLAMRGYYDEELIISQRLKLRS